MLNVDTSSLTSRQPRTEKRPVKRSPKPRKSTATWWAGTRSAIAGLPQTAVTLTVQISKPTESLSSDIQVRYTPIADAVLGLPISPLDDWRQSEQLDLDEDQQVLIFSKRMPPEIQEEVTKWLLGTTILPIWT